MGRNQNLKSSTKLVLLLRGHELLFLPIPPCLHLSQSLAQSGHPSRKGFVTGTQDSWGVCHVGCRVCAEDGPELHSTLSLWVTWNPSCAVD